MGSRPGGLPWIGKELPILEYIKTNRELSQGNWVLFFCGPDNTMRRYVCPEFERLARETHGLYHFAIIDMKKDRKAKDATVEKAWLDDDRDWLMPSTFAILEESVVRSVWTSRTIDMIALSKIMKTQL